MNAKDFLTMLLKEPPPREIAGLQARLAESGAFHFQQARADKLTYNKFDMLISAQDAVLIMGFEKNTSHAGTPAVYYRFPPDWEQVLSASAVTRINELIALCEGAALIGDHLKAKHDGVHA